MLRIEKEKKKKLQEWKTNNNLQIIIMIIIFSYFANIHPILPVIDKREFLEQYRDKCASYPGGDLINAMFGAAARFVETESLDPERKNKVPLDAQWDLPVGWSDHFFDQAQKIISNGLLGPATISTIQAIVLIQNQRATVDTKSSTCWLTGGFVSIYICMPGGVEEEINICGTSYLKYF